MKRKPISIITTTVFAVVLLAGLLTGCMDPVGADGPLAATGVSIMGTPSVLTEVEIAVSGPGMQPIGPVVLAPGSRGITLEVPVGPDRLFDINGGWFTFRRLAAVRSRGLDLRAAMQPLIVVPDRENDRVVVMRDMSGRGWISMNSVAEEEGPPAPISFPRWVDFDGSGRLLVYHSGSALSTLARPGPAGLLVESATVTGFDVATPDRDGGYLFFGTGSSLARWDGEGAVGFMYDGWIEDMVYHNGYLYLVGYTEDSFSEEPGVEKYDPATLTVVRSFTSEEAFPSLSAPRAITVVNGAVYVANPDGPDGYKMLKFDSNLRLLSHFGSFPADPQNPRPGEFYGPREFVPTLGKRLIVMDGGGSESEGTLVNRLVAFNDVGSTDGWQTLGQRGSGTGEFSFYYEC